MKRGDMTLEKDDAELDQLLSRGRLSGAQYDLVERRVLERTLPKRTTRWPLLLAAAFSVLGASALLLRDGSTFGEDELRSKGASAKGVALLDVGCSGERPKVCRLGDTMMFSAELVERDGYLAAYAEPVGRPGTRIWYFPAADGSAPRLAAARDTVVLQQGVRLGPPHEKGKYRVTLWLADSPFGREKPASVDLSRKSSVEFEIVE